MGVQGSKRGYIAQYIGDHYPRLNPFRTMKNSPKPDLGWNVFAQASLCPWQAAGLAESETGVVDQTWRAPINLL